MRVIYHIMFNKLYIILFVYIVYILYVYIYFFNRNENKTMDKKRSKYKRLTINNNFS